MKNKTETAEEKPQRKAFRAEGMAFQVRDMGRWLLLTEKDKRFKMRLSSVSNGGSHGTSPLRIASVEFYSK